MFFFYVRQNSETAYHVELPENYGNKLMFYMNKLMNGGNVYASQGREIAKYGQNMLWVGPLPRQNSA